MSDGGRVLVTGSQGFVGKHLRRELEARRARVIGVDRPGTGAEIEVDLSDPALDVRAIAARAGTVDSVLYMAATITRGSSVDALARDNLRAIADAPVRLMEALVDAGTSPHLVYCSTYKSYGPAKVQPIDPEMPPQSPDPHSYGSAKSLGERLLAISSARAGYTFAIVRPTCIYGPGQHLHNAIPTFLRNVWEGKPPTLNGHGDSVRDDVFAPDLSWLLAEVGERRAVGAFHAGGERPRTILETAEVCCRAVESLGGPAGLHPAIDATKKAKWWLDQTFDLTRSLALGYAPISLLEGLRAEARWITAGSVPADATSFVPSERLGAHR